MSFRFRLGIRSSGCGTAPGSPVTMSWRPKSRWRSVCSGQQTVGPSARAWRSPCARPGDDFELALGFLHGEGIIASREDVLDVNYCLDEAEDQRLNVVTVTLGAGLTFDLSRLERNFYTTSSCGICGKAALDSLDLQGYAPLRDGPRIRADVIRVLPEKLRREQAVFRSTGGLHAAGLFDLEGNLLDLREDVGRHNALDKLVGRQLLQNEKDLSGRVVLLSGRASFELLQKALAARVPIVAAVGAPSSLAVEVATTFNITLLGFVRPDGFNIYTGGERVVQAMADR